MVHFIRNSEFIHGLELVETICTEPTSLNFREVKLITAHRESVK